MDAAEYKHVVLGLVFLRYVSEVFAVRHDELERLVADPDSDYFTPDEADRAYVLEDRDEYTSEGVFWVPEGHRWDDLVKAGKQPNIGELIDAAMDAIERENPTLKGVLPKNYARRELTPQILGGLLDTFSRNDLASAEHADKDVLGRVFEYMVSQFASAEGKLGGEFYTPSSVVRLMVEMIEPFNGRVYDPACGSGGMFVQADKFVKAHGGVRNDIAVYGEEQNPTTWRLAKMNLALRGIEADLGPQWGDSFHNDLHPDLRADFVLANPPFNVSEWGGERLREDPRWKYGIPPAGNANFAWLQHMLHHLAPTGTMASVLALGSLSSNQQGEGEIRKALVDEDLVECIVALPGQLFFTTPIPVCIWFLTKDKSGQRVKSERPQRDRAGEVLFIDAREMGRMVSRIHRELSQEDINKIAATFHAWRGEPGERPYVDEAGYSAAVSLAAIRDQSFALSPGRYVGNALADDDGEEIGEKIARLASDVRAGFERRAQIQADVIAALDALKVSTDA
jgi:type I restriction enzyme M protein